jgi:hypothetical protein
MLLRYLTRRSLQSNGKSFSLTEVANASGYEACHLPFPHPETVQHRPRRAGRRPRPRPSPLDDPLTLRAARLKTSSNVLRRRDIHSRTTCRQTTPATGETATTRARGRPLPVWQPARVRGTGRDCLHTGHRAMTATHPQALSTAQAAASARAAITMDASRDSHLSSSSCPQGESECTRRRTQIGRAHV